MFALEADQKLGVTQTLKEVSDHGIVKQTTSKMMDGVQQLGDLLSKVTLSELKNLPNILRRTKSMECRQKCTKCQKGLEQIR